MTIPPQETPAPSRPALHTRLWKFITNHRLITALGVIASIATLITTAVWFVGILNHSDPTAVITLLSTEQDPDAGVVLPPNTDETTYVSNKAIVDVNVTGLDDTDQEVYLVIDTPLDIWVPENQPVVVGNTNSSQQLFIGNCDDNTGAVFTVKALIGEDPDARDATITELPPNAEVIGELALTRFGTGIC